MDAEETEDEDEEAEAEDEVEKEEKKRSVEEEKRNEEDANESGMWEESFKSHQDSKPRGYLTSHEYDILCFASQLVHSVLNNFVIFIKISKKV